MTTEIKDLGDIEFLRNHPKILEKLIERSEAKSLEPFIECSLSSKDHGGFDWMKSIEGFAFWDNILVQMNLEHFYTLYPEPQSIASQSTATQSLTQTQEKMTIYKTKTIKVNGEDRDVTVAITTAEPNRLVAGYSIRLPKDEVNKELAETIALGRALKDKTQVNEQMFIHPTMAKKYILYSVADNILGKIERGVIKVKGVKSLS